MKIMIYLYYFYLSILPAQSLRTTKILNATYLSGVSFHQLYLNSSEACMCSCIQHPHCFTISIKKKSTKYFCQLYATYPQNSSYSSSSLISNVTIYFDRVLTSVYIDNGTGLSHPNDPFASDSKPWIPTLKLYTNNGQPFLWFNSSHSTTRTSIPNTAVDNNSMHWYSVLISQWNRGVYKPKQVAIAFIVNRTIIFDFLIFNAAKSNITSWFSITRLLSNQYWSIISYRNTTEAQTQMTAIYTDDDVIRSFNCNFKNSTTHCQNGFQGFFFVHGGYKDSCMDIVQQHSTIPIPTIYYNPTSYLQVDNFSNYEVADSLMVFVR